mmetsp:Transcript_35153/g.109874  ORF Transcript_35153/g.109874 Transcript_35153/m.109874 type:complete len:205 (+) Transcript_35153:224-838(+)
MMTTFICRDVKKRKKAKSDESEADGEKENAKKKKRKQKPSTPEDSEAEEGEDERPKKDSAAKGKSKSKAKGEQSDSDERASTSGPVDSSSNEADNQNSKSSTPFKRIKEEDVTYMKVRGGHTEATRLKDNTFESKNGDAYGAKAAGILGQVRGRDFRFASSLGCRVLKESGYRHEKTKKKRSYRSPGAIDLSSNSIKFESSDDE